MFIPEELLLQPILKTENGIVFTTMPTDSFENVYIRLRKKEGWFYTGAALQQLPDVKKSDLQYASWQIRKKTSNRLVKYLHGKQNTKYILDIGCGNGWLTNKLAKAIPGAQLIGVDINVTELQLAALTFHASNITWLYGDVLNNLFKQNIFDIIVLSASIQYFPDVKILVHSLLHYLKPGGEIHILDSPFYTQAESEKAAERSANYYIKANVPEMQKVYHHHTLKSLQEFNIEKRYTPNVVDKLLSKITHYVFVPFMWVVVRKN